MTLKNKNTIGIILLSISLIVILLDFVFINEFNIEGVYLALVLPIFLFNFYSRIKPLFKHLHIISSLLLLAICIYQLWFLLLIGWGYGYLGTSVPLIWTTSFLLNICLSIMSVSRILKRL